MRGLVTRRLEGDAEVVRQSHAEAIVELQGVMPSIHVERDVELVDQTPVFIAHKLGKVPRFVGISAIRFPGAATAGQVIENRNGVDRTKTVVLVAAQYTTPIIVDVLIIA